MIGKLYVPTAVDDSIERQVKRELADAFGGYTAYGAAGGWVFDGEIIEEPVTVYEIVNRVDGDSEKLYDCLLKQANYIFANTDENEVLAYADGRLIRVN